MIQLLTAASKSAVLSKEFSLVSDVHQPNSFIRKNDLIPIINNAGFGNELAHANWGIHQAAISTKAQHTTPLSGILSKPKLKILIRKNRCVIPMNCFCISKGETVYLIRLLTHRIFGAGAIYSRKKNGQIEASIITTSAPDILRSICTEVPVMFPADKTDKWLGDREMHDIYYTADRTGNYWFDFFKVSPMVLEKGITDVNLLKPLGLSFQQIKHREDKLKALKIKQDRVDRAGRK